MYRWLLFFHFLGLSAFLLVHGVSAATALALRRRAGPADSRFLLGLSAETYPLSYGALLLVIATGVWMAFLGSWWGHGWIWVSIAVLITLLAAMGFLAQPFREARMAGDDDEKRATAVSQARPVTLTWLGALGWSALLFLMVLKPF